MSSDTRKYTNSELKLLILNGDSKSDVLREFWKLRYQIFMGHSKTFYKSAGPEVYDLHPETIFIIIMNNKDRVMGGRRIIIQNPKSKTMLPQLKTEETIPVPLHLMLYHIPIKTLVRAEFGSLCFHEDIRGKDKNGESFLPVIYKESFKQVHLNNVDIIETETVTRNFSNFFKGTQDAGMKQFHNMRSMLVPYSKESEQAFKNSNFKLIDSKVYDINSPETLKLSELLMDRELAEKDGPIRGVHVADGKEKYFLSSAFSIDGYFDVRTVTSPLPETQIPLISPQMQKLGIGRLD